MDVDCDFDSDLLSKFSCLGTTDRDVLINELQRLLDFQLNPTGCAFFLDMTNWNLQAAIGAYYDFNSTQDKLPSMTFVRDVTIGEGESVPPNTTFVKTWRIQNNGSSAWPSGVFLKYTSGDQLGPVNLVSVKPLDPGEYYDLSINMISPSKMGMYQGQWRMCNPAGQYFGDIIWVIICVEESGLLGLTQQLSSLGREMISSQGSSPISPTNNPFQLSTPLGNSPQPIYSVPHNSPANGVVHVSPARRLLFNSMINVEEPLIAPTTQGESSLSNKDEETLINDLGDASILVDSERDNT
ncbi:PREDICTED: uncharacterized protein C6orf106 homolog [Acropora digitifera]|uniref:uncharacterized protein C6orf106 homolog n=1 Tax=Acropora digitifera TaxID=70779 RepID=UPI00077ACA42|nr:PREDICTED: uncharacterized protein C6orf106 homolog [Acropora digitifera]